ncbi:thioredoxin-like domain-containing protein [Cerasicoccus arenae]|uniref:thioredoxin-like domain-containing protein n=1 Tax=Cerasicoccus arenae TaxID=424488 RepID=UPI0016795492|nr:thioredoxin-like domain-containing protein [Cerasicoccus arenae]MBK1857463.1 redoxin domain-containing protein [Cerasicoccus arenae]
MSDARVWKDQSGQPMTADFVETYDKGGETFVVFTKGDGMRYQVPLQRLSAEDQQYIADLQANDGVDPNLAAAERTVEKTPFEKAIFRDLVKRDGDRVISTNGGKLEPKEYYGIYYSAHWCPPCRGFTPKLIEYYNKASATHGNFEIIFVSSDRSEDAMEGYITEYEMPWLSLDFDKKDSAKQLTQFSASGIPCLVLVDRNGEILKHSYVGGKYVGPTSVLNELDRLLNEKEG